MIALKYSVALDFEQVLSLIGQLPDEKKRSVFSFLQRELDAKHWSDDNRSPEESGSVDLEEIWENHTLGRENMVGRWIGNETEDDFNRTVKFYE